MKVIHVVEISGAPEPIIQQNIERLGAAGFSVVYVPYDSHVGHRLEPQGIAQRAQILSESLLSGRVDYVMAARGGYGASDLLPHLDWTELSKVSPRLLIGFSDITALQAALKARLNWPALHGPMPGSPAWCEDAAADEMVAMLLAGAPFSGEIVIENPKDQATPEIITGELFGGCLSVLTNLIGTPDLPAPGPERILFLEDINERPERVLRCWNQWREAGQFDGVRAVVLGRFLGLESEACEAWLVERLRERIECPVFVSREFGHGIPNRPIAMGGLAAIQQGKLRWHLDC